MVVVPVLLAVVWLGIVLLLQRSGRLERWRWMAYAAALLLLPPAGFLAGVLEFEHRICSRDVHECDLGVLEGLVVAAAIVAIWLVTVVTVEVVLGRRKRAERLRTSAR